MHGLLTPFWVPPHERRALQGSDDGLVKVWSLTTGYLIYTLRAHTVRARMMHHGGL